MNAKLVRYVNNIPASIGDGLNIISPFEKSQDIIPIMSPLMNPIHRSSVKIVLASGIFL